MEKPVTEVRTFCDFCDQEAHVKCLLCGKDLCDEHRTELSIYAHGPQLITGALCPTDAAAPFTVLSDFKRESSNLMQRASYRKVWDLKPEDVVGFIFYPNAPAGTLSRKAPSMSKLVAKGGDVK